MMIRIAAVAFALCLASLSYSAKICIDAGHGGSDAGALSCNGSNYEKTNTLNTALKFRDWLNRDTNDGAGGGSWSVVMTRSSDIYVSLQGRCDISNNAGADRFMCIHNNAFNCSANGTETFSWSSSGTGADLRNKVQDRTIQAWGRVNRGVKTANFYVLVNTNAPAELAELAFIDHSGDNVYVAGATHQDNVAKYHMYALQNHYGITAYTPGTGAKTYVNDAPSCSANWATGTSSTDKYGADYRWRSTAALSDPAAWTISVSPGGNHDISAWWTAGTNRSTAAPYILPGGANPKVNQQINGGKWNLLGTVSLAAGNNTTQLSCWAATGYIVVADAVKYYGPK